MKVKLCMQIKFYTTIMMFKQHVCKQCYMSTTASGIHYDRDHSHCIVSSNVLVGRGGAIRNNNTFEYILDMT